MSRLAKVIAAAMIPLLSSSAGWASEATTLLKELSPGTRIELPAELVFERGKARIAEPSHTTIVGKDGKLVGNSTLYLPFAGMERPLPKSEVEEVLKKLQKSPKPGLYCFLNANLRKALAIEEKSIRVGARSFKVNSCFEKDAVTSSDGTTTTNIQFSFFGKTNRVAIHGCFLVDEQDPDPSNPDAYQLGCISYRTTTVPTVADFLKALGLTQRPLVVSAPAASPAVRTAAQASRAPVGAPGNNRDCPECRKAAEKPSRERPSEITSETLDASQKWFDALLNRLPKADSKDFREWEARNPIGSMLHRKCVLESVTVSTNIAMQSAPVDAAMPASCTLFFDTWNAR